MKKISIYIMACIILSVVLSGCGETITGELTPSKPALQSPIESSQSTTLRLRWGVSLNATGYDVYLGKTQNTMDMIAQNVGTTFFDVVNLDHSSVYYWKVVAKNTLGIASSNTKAFSTHALRAGNYVEIKDIATNGQSAFTLTLSGNCSNIRALEVILEFDPNEVQLAPEKSVDEIDFINSLADAFGLISFGQNTLTISISAESNFSLNNEEFLRINCTSGFFTGISRITINNGSTMVDENFNNINFNKTDTGYVFVR